MVRIGLDPGTNTGLAVYDSESKRLTCVETLKIHQAMDFIRDRWNAGGVMMVTFEDARLVGGGGFMRDRKSAMARSQGAGSVKRDCSIWADFLADLGCPYHTVSPRQKGTKLDAEPFAKLTGWTGRTSQHARDAAMLVFGK